MKQQGQLLLNFCMIAILLPFCAIAQSNTIFGNNGKIKFTSEAAMEIIDANSDKLKAAIDKSKNTFAFALEIKTLKGFNSDLQREHFHENYAETDKFPTATFAGKFIEQVNFSVNGTYIVRAKGMFALHGIQNERIIKGTMVVNNGVVSISAAFTVRLEDYDIKVPKIVYEKIAKEVRIEINIQLKQ
jgi:polyisoprenoid-binding protein YceI